MIFLCSPARTYRPQVTGHRRAHIIKSDVISVAFWRMALLYVIFDLKHHREVSEVSFPHRNLFR